MFVSRTAATALLLVIANLATVVDAQACFVSNQELANAVQGYLNDDADVLETYGDTIGDWCVSGVTNFTGIFLDAANFSEPLSGWDVSNAIEMMDMFHGATSFDQDISMWNVSSVLTMRNMFQNTRSFNSPLSDWDVSSVVNMRNLFYGSAFNQSIEAWNVRNVQTMSNMFAFSLFFHFLWVGRKQEIKLEEQCK